MQPEAIALADASGWRRSYRELNERTNRAARLLRALGVRRGERVAILSENRPEYLELQLACAKLGAMVACQNVRLAPSELKHCVDLVAPRVAVVSERHRSNWQHSAATVTAVVALGEEYEEGLAKSSPREIESDAEPEDGFLILYTSGTTGLPKGAVISQRAELVRYTIASLDLGLRGVETPVVWAPLFHMIGAEVALATLMGGGKVLLVDGFQPTEIAYHVGREPIGYLALLPGIIEPLIQELEQSGTRPVSVRLCGAMADLVPPDQIARITRLLSAPYCNSFGSTETGAPPASAGVIPIGEAPRRLSKRQNSFGEIRLVDAHDEEVLDGTPGELTFRGPTLFSGYWNAPEANERDFRGGWFHLGDVFVRNGDGTLDFVDRVKYLIKSGGENIYPAEIERVLYGEPRVADAVVVRRKDPKWGEVPVAVVVRKDESLTADELFLRCRGELAGYKQPKEIIFAASEQLPRSMTGKIQRHEVETWLIAASKSAH
jgi:acyl-CoA synthetase (AMP-forming)/AMP-acid ligase II